MTYVVTIGDNVTEIEAKMKHILAMNKFVQLFLPFRLGQTSRKEVNHELDTSSMGKVEFHPT